MANSAPEHRASCTPFNDKELPFERDYKLLNTKAEIQSYYDKVYNGDRRLMARAYWDASQKTIVLPYSSGNARVPAAFWEGVASHITQAFKNDYVNGLIYPDLGHIHVLVPTKTWDELKVSTPQSIERIEKVFALSETKALYHTAEMVQLKQGDFAKGTYPQDPWKLWRYFTRNLLGSFIGEKNVEVIWAGEKPTYNTVRSLPGYTDVVTLYISSNHNACLSFHENGTEKFFDITAETIPYEKPSAREPSSKTRTPKPDFH